jgi:hypothetical protein
MMADARKAGAAYFACVVQIVAGLLWVCRLRSQPWPVIDGGEVFFEILLAFGSHKHSAGKREKEILRVARPARK